jgi:hypothetical protein
VEPAVWSVPETDITVSAEKHRGRLVVRVEVPEQSSESPS